MIGFGVFGGFPWVPPRPPLVPLYPPGSPLSGFCVLRDSPPFGYSVFGVFGVPLSPPGTLVFGVFGTPFFGVFGTLKFTPFLVPALLGFPNSVDSLCRARGGSVHRDTLFGVKKGCFGGGQKVPKKGQKRGKIENDFFKVWKKRSKQPLPPHLT